MRTAGWAPRCNLHVYTGISPLEGLLYAPEVAQDSGRKSWVTFDSGGSSIGTALTIRHRTTQIPVFSAVYSRALSEHVRPLNQLAIQH